jgi:hypothetical protein
MPNRAASNSMRMAYGTVEQRHKVSDPLLRTADVLQARANVNFLAHSMLRPK